MKRITASIAAVILAAAVIATIAVAAPKAGDESTSLDGTWVRTELFPADGAKQKWVKQIDGTREKVTVYNEAGEVILAWKVDIELRDTGDVRLFVFRNFTFTEGTEEGKTIEGEYAYIYRLRDDTIYEVQGMLIDDKLPDPKMLIWKRQK